ncbi:unnamed protein product, partial [marine sediment metagenome]
FDIFLEPDMGNVTSALECLEELGFTVSTREGLLGDPQPENLELVLSERMSLCCTTPYGHAIDLCLQVSGFSYDELNGDVKTFKAGKIPIRVGSLRKLLRMKEIAGREKDVLFLEKYRPLFEEEM